MVARLHLGLNSYSHDCKPNSLQLSYPTIPSLIFKKNFANFASARLVEHQQSSYPEIGNFTGSDVVSLLQNVLLQ